MAVTPKMCFCVFSLLQPQRWLKYIYYPFEMPDKQTKKKEAAERGRKRTREGSSQTDEEDTQDQHHKAGCFEDSSASRLSGIEEKLDMLLAILPKLETYKKRITLLEEENKASQASLENSQAETEDLKVVVNDVKKRATPPVNASSANSKNYTRDMLNSNVTVVEVK